MKKSSKKVRRLKKKRVLILVLFVVFILLGSFTYVYIKNDEGTIFETPYKEPKSNNKIVSISSNIDKVYLAIGGTKDLKVEIEKEGEPDETLTWKSSDESIVTVDENGHLVGKANGKAKVIVSTNYENEYTFDVTVTDLIQVPTIGISYNRKPTLPCNRYTKEEAALLDEILFARVAEAGDGTRGGAVAAARFLLLEFPYEVRYFNENGRMNGGYAKVDAEGRYYHKGLYLDSSKFESVKISMNGPQIWGCPLYDNMLGSKRPNGLTCSGFVSWALYNGGLDVGDVGAGDYPHIDNELSDMGPHQKITYEFMASNKYKVGDFIARDGHAALIIGLTEDKVYTAESLIPGVQVHIYDRYKGIVEEKNPFDKLTYIIDMTDIYPNGEGVYTDMWSSTSTS